MLIDTGVHPTQVRIGTGGGLDEYQPHQADALVALGVGVQQVGAPLLLSVGHT